MRMLRPRTPLFNTATDDASNGGGAPVPAAAPAVETPAVETPAPKPGVIATATALLRGANANAATVAALRADLTARESTIEHLRSELAARDATIAGITAELQTFRTQAADLQAAVAELEKKQVDVQTEVIHQLATAGLPEKDLPQGSSSTSPSANAEDLWKQAEATSDPTEKGRLAAQALKLTSGKIHALN